MFWYQILFLALIQGLTEFLPISSSAHLILPAQVLNWPDQGLAFDVAVHVGTLIAVVTYFYRDIVQVVGGWFSSLMGKGSTEQSKLGWCLIIGTIPAGLAGLVFNDFIEANLRSVEVIAYATIGFGILLWLADRFGSNEKSEYQLTWRTSLMIGIAQAIALIPGTSRSGITMTAARAFGFNRESSARFSFLLSIPLIVLAGGYKLVQLLTTDVYVEWGSLFSGVILSALSAYFCIYFFLKWLNTIGFTPFLIYRLILGGVLLALVYAG
ncbi:UDP pyrophosphate phosphatase [Marinomonas sp. SBI22]|uniref:undecaprenyl-diphosphate phosphatase n=1 Tax=unclassified Marinomonas TaxID=196814 RepID=UPI0007AF4061|nr:MULTISPECIES: undecaprenyl-diphosphate phosphatase [unclassified Marinomonas]KZM40775.1 UDP pyrophosphate phosphatase [Marinomonas sp. SBI8L]KZM46041.1 UDP pyrophosphate phosphatase [Marinomonas sp. SBI22]